MKTRTYSKLQTWLAAALLAVLGACDGGSAAGPPPEQVLINVTTPELTLLPGEVGQVVATVQGGAGAPEWTTSDPAIATVDAAGTVTAKAPGDATVTASYRGARGSAAVRVKPRSIARVASTPDAATLHFVGDSVRLSAAAYDATGAPVAASVTWSSSDAAVATVDADGKVTARGTGLARIVATSGAKADSSMIQVIQVVAALAVSPAAQTLTVGQTAPLQAAARDSGGVAVPGVGVTWTSSNPAVASVDAGGTVRAVAPGSAALTASAQGVSASARVDVTAVPVATLSISPASFSLTVGQTAPATAIARDAAGNALTGRAVAWSTSDPTVATVASGVVTAVGAGSATITATVEGKTASAPVAVQRVPVATVSISPASFALQVGANAQAAAVAKDAAGNVLTGRVVTWSSSNPAVANVSPVGVVWALAPGTATITATVEGKSGSAPVTVQAVPIATLSISPASFSLTVGQSATATAVAKDAAGNVLTGRVVAWTSSNPAVATVASGVVTAVAAGSATITATSEGRSATAPVTVSAPPAPPTGGGTATILASNNFEGGTLGPFTDNAGADGAIVNDPTGSGRGKVMSFRYTGTNQDRNRSIQYEHAAGIGLGQTIFVRGDFYLPAGINTSPFVGRKLLYFQRDYQSGKYAGGFPEFWSIVVLFGTELKWTGGYVAPGGAGVETMTPLLRTLTPGRWYTLEMQLTMNSSFSARDGVTRIWLDGEMLYEKTDMRWSDPAWTMSPADQKFRFFQVGQQVNYMQGSFDEHRYWDNVTFSTQRVAR